LCVARLQFVAGLDIRFDRIPDFDVLDLEGGRWHGVGARRIRPLQRLAGKHAQTAAAIPFDADKSFALARAQ